MGGGGGGVRGAPSLLSLVVASFICQEHINCIYLDMYSPPFAIRTHNPEKEIKNALFSIYLLFSISYYIHIISFLKNILY